MARAGGAAGVNEPSAEAFTRQVSAQEVTGGLPRVCWQPGKVSGCCSRPQAGPAEQAKSGRAHREGTHTPKM